MIKKIIDVSKWNGITNFSIINEKVDGVIVRVGFRGNTSPVLVNDPRYIPYMTELNKYDNPLGAYFMTSAITREEAQEEANFFIDCLESANIKLSIPLFVKTDWTMSTHYGRSDDLNPEERTDIIIAFISECKKRGYGCGIAATDKWFKEQLCLNRLVGYAKWIINKIDKASLKEFDDAVMIKTINDKFEVKGIAGYVVLAEINTSILSPYIKKESTIKKEVVTKEKLVEEKPVVKETTKKKYKLGSRIKLKDAELFETSVCSTVKETLNGYYYVSNDKVLRGRIRISDAKGGSTIGWISI